MKKQFSFNTKQFLAAAIISVAIGLPVAAQDRGGYISSTGRGGYVSSSDQAGTTSSITAQETGLAEITDGTGTMGSGGLTTSDDEESILDTIVNWISSVF